MQFSLIASATLLVTPVIVAKASGRDESYLVWMVFASLLVVGVSTLIQVRRLGPVGAGAVLLMFTAAFSIPFCITALVDGGPATLTTLVLVSVAAQLIISKWLFILRRIVTPTVGGTVMMILSITLASVIFGLLDQAAAAEPVAAPLTALATLGIVVALALRGSALAASLGAGNRHCRRLPGCRRTRNLQHRPGAASPLGGTAQRLARFGTGLRHSLLDAASGLSFPRCNHLHTGQLRSHCLAAGRLAG